MAQKTVQEIKQEINSRLPDNQEQLISPEDLRSVLTDISDSYFNDPQPVIPQGTVTAARNVGPGIGFYDSMSGSILEFRGLVPDPSDENPITIIEDIPNKRVLLKAPRPTTLLEPVNILTHPKSNTVNISNREEIEIYSFVESDRYPYGLNYISISVNGEEVPIDTNHVAWYENTKTIKLITGPLGIRYALDTSDDIIIRFWR